MVDPETHIEAVEVEITQRVPEDVGMEGADAGSEVMEVEDLTGNGADAEAGATAPARISHLDYLMSPIIHIAVDTGETRKVVNAHEKLLQRSPFLAEACAELGEGATERAIELPNDEIEPVGCFLQWLYTGEYFPKILLKHAKVYTLATKLGVEDLKVLSRNKIHRVNSSAKGEITYARYVYANTPPSDVAIKKPVAAFWAHRSHVLRHEAEFEFKQMCLEFPQFAYDVLSLVLDAKEKGRTDHHPAERSARKRQRTSQA